MAEIALVKVSPNAVGTVAPGESLLFASSDDGRMKQKDGDTQQTTDLTRLSDNRLINGGHAFAQRQVAATLTALAFSATDRIFGADLWGVTAGATNVQYQRVDTSIAAETGLRARYYGKYKKGTGTGKLMVSQVLVGDDTVNLQGRIVRVQALLKRSVASSMVVRLGLGQLTSTGTVDTIPATFVSAFNGVGVDPTLGTNLAYIAPMSGTQENGTIVGNAVQCTLDVTWKRFSATWLVPTDAKNLVWLLWTNDVLAVNDELNIGEAGLYEGSAVQEWVPVPRTDELARCEAFYEKTFQMDIAPAQNAGLLGALYFPLVTTGAVATSIVGFWRFRTRKFKTPTTITFFNPSAANAFARNTAASTDATATSAADLSETNIRINATGIAGWTILGVPIAVQATAELKI